MPRRDSAEAVQRVWFVLCWGSMGKQPNPPTCPRCGQPMRLASSVPPGGTPRELHTFLCMRCGEVTSIEREPLADGREYGQALPCR
jgi:hypothetical protein